MSLKNRMSQITIGRTATVPGVHQEWINRTARGENPNVPFSFRELRISRGTVAHPPNTDRTEVRPSITLEFLGVPGARGPVMAHLFQDGTIKTADQMWQEINARRAEEARLAAEEGRFPQLQQTVGRRAAWDTLMATIDQERRAREKSVIAKQVVKDNAFLRYRAFLREQEQARAAAARASEK